MKVYGEWHLPPEQEQAWIHDRAGALVGRNLAEKHGWKLGDKIILNGTIFPVNLNLTVRAITDAEDSAEALYFDYTYVEEAVNWAKGQDGMFAIRVDSAEDVPWFANRSTTCSATRRPDEDRVRKGVSAWIHRDDGKCEGVHPRNLEAVVFAILLVSGNTMAMSIRERIREVAVLKTLGFTRMMCWSCLSVKPSRSRCLEDWQEWLLANVLIQGLAQSPMGGMFRD